MRTSRQFLDEPLAKGKPLRQAAYAYGRRFRLAVRRTKWRLRLEGATGLRWESLWDCGSCVAFYLAVALILSSARAGAVGGEVRALLVGVPQVPGLPEVAVLEGPENDVASLREELVGRWGVAAESIRVLVGSSASKRAILNALDRVVSESSSGDLVLIYFSGHGLSAHERLTGTSGYGMDIRTGALVPADVTPGPASAILAQLIVGSRDLKPRFQRLDAVGAETFVVIDACYSGDSAKAVPRLVPRSASVVPPVRTAVDEWDRTFMHLLATEDVKADWPYERVVYISAAARDELAFDISSKQARGERPTIDGRAHGVLTNGLLLALRGGADRDRDGRIVYSELHEYLVEAIQRNGQTPQLYPRRKAIIEQPVLGGGPHESESPRPLRALGPLRVRIDPADPDLKALLAPRTQIRLTSGEYDLEVRRRDGRFHLYLASGAEVGKSYADRMAVSEVLRRRAAAHQLAGLRYPGQDMRFAIILEPERGVYRKNDVLQVKLRPGQDAWLLLLAIDPEGRIYVVHPASPTQARRVRAGEEFEVVALGVEAPFGTDRLEGFAFRHKPADYDRWVGRQPPLDGSDLEQMVRMLSANRGEPGRGRASRIVFTRPRQ